MTFSPSWYTTHPDEQKSDVSLDSLTLDAFDKIASKAALSNEDRMAAAITKADGFAWQTANPWFKSTDSNLKIVNQWLSSKGINYPTYPDFTEAAEELVNTGLLDVDGAARAQHLDGNGPKTFALSGRKYDSLDSMITQERKVAVDALAADKPSDLERAFEHLPIEQAQAALREGERRHQVTADAKVSEQNADSWLTLHPEWRDDATNAKLMAAQLHLNGFKPPYSISDYEIAERQLVEAGMVRQNPKALEKQKAAEVVARAQHAVKNSAAFDTTTEDAMYELPLDEVRRRANNNYTGVGF